MKEKKERKTWIQEMAIMILLKREAIYSSEKIVLKCFMLDSF